MTNLPPFASQHGLYPKQSAQYANYPPPKQLMVPQHGPPHKRVRFTEEDDPYPPTTRSEVEGKLNWDEWKKYQAALGLKGAGAYREIVKYFTSHCNARLEPEQQTGSNHSLSSTQPLIRIGIQLAIELNGQHVWENRALQRAAAHFKRFLLLSYCLVLEEREIQERETQEREFGVDKIQEREFEVHKILYALHTGNEPGTGQLVNQWKEKTTPLVKELHRVIELLRCCGWPLSRATEMIFMRKIVPDQLDTCGKKAEIAQLWTVVFFWRTMLPSR